MSTAAMDAPTGRYAVPPALAQRMRPVLPQLSARIARDIHREIDAYTPEAGESDVELTRRGVAEAIQFFVDHIENSAAPRDEVDEWFRRIGRGEAFAGRSLDALRTAYQIGSRLAWKSLHALAVEEGLPSSTLGELGDALFDYMNSLSEQSVVGFQEAQVQLSDAAYQWRERLLELILEAPRSSAREISQLASTGNWSVPRQLVIIAIDRTPGVPMPHPRRLHPRTLANLRSEAPVVLHPAPCDDEARLELASIFLGHTISIGCPVALEEASSSLRWARRGLQLAATGVIEPQPVIDCTEHVSQLWLHSEPLLRQRLSTAVLAPLFAESPNSRRIIAETTLAWLETRGSAPALAAHLGKHAQTIRYRLKRMHEVFGDALDDDERCFEMYLALRASMPLWKSGRIGPEPERSEPAGRRLRRL